MAWQDVLAALNAALPDPAVDPFDYATGFNLALVLSAAGAAYTTSAARTVVIPPAKIYTGVAPDGSSVVSFSEIPSLPLQVTPDELFKAGKYLMSLIGVSGTMFDSPIPPCPTVSIPVADASPVTMPDTGFALGWAYVARDAYAAAAALASPLPLPPLAVEFYGSLGSPGPPVVPPSGVFLPMMAEAVVWATYIRSFPAPVYIPGNLVAPTTIAVLATTSATGPLLDALNMAVTNAASFTAYLLS